MKNGLKKKIQKEVEVLPQTKKNKEREKRKGRHNESYTQGNSSITVKNRF